MTREEKKNYQKEWFQKNKNYHKERYQKNKFKLKKRKYISDPNLILSLKEKCDLAIEKGYIYNPETGKIIGPKGKILSTESKSRYLIINLYYKNKIFHLSHHQFAWYWINKECVDCLDHINGNRYDNRISNLRSVTKQENHFNRKTVKGYYYRKSSNKYYAGITINNKKIYLGAFDNEEDASKAYLEAKEKYHKIKK